MVSEQNKNKNQTSVAKTHFSNLIIICQRLTVAGLKYLGIGGLVLFALTLALPVQASSLISNEDQLIQLTNQIRTVRGIPVLAQNALLGESAQNKAEDMASKGYFDHADQDGNRMSYWMRSAGYDYLRAGENLAKGFSTPEAVIQAWLNSPTHYMNLVNDNYTEIGVGVATGVIDGKATIVVVQHFGQPMPQFTTPNLVAGLVFGDSIDIETTPVAPLPPSTGGELATKDLIVNENISDNAVINTTPKGLLFVAYGIVGDTSNAIAQTWDNWQADWLGSPYTSDLPRTNYQVTQAFIVMAGLIGATWLTYQLIVPILALLGRKSKVVIKIPSK
ncbi:CAP domain-containing protein [Patescibacteria group bacterium]|nr:CAP domain-containing protein [Patescibacteria group bacterium]